MKCSKCGEKWVEENEELVERYIAQKDIDLDEHLYHYMCTCRDEDSSICVICIIDECISNLMDSVCGMRKLKGVMK